MSNFDCTTALLIFDTANMPHGKIPPTDPRSHNQRRQGTRTRHTILGGGVHHAAVEGPTTGARRGIFKGMGGGPGHR